MRIPYSRQDINNSDIDRVKSVLKSDFLTQGPLVKKFEKKISQFVHSKYAVAANSATSALHLACLSIGLKKDDWLWTSPNSFVASANCGLLCGAKVDFVDIDKNTLNMSIFELEKKLIKAKNQNKLPKIVVPVHFAGLPCDMSEIFRLSKKYNFKIIEDASHALGSKYKNNFIGNCKFSDIAVFSFHPVKIVTTGEGGVATTNNKVFAEKMSMLRTHGINRIKSRFYNRSEGPWYFEQVYLGLNYRMNDIEATLGVGQLKRLNKFINRRNQIAKIYNRDLKSLPIKFNTLDKNVRSTFHLYVIQINNKKTHFTQLELFNFFKKNKVDINVHYIPIHFHPYFKKMGFKKGQFPVTENYYKNCISLPIYYSLKKYQQNRIINLLRLFFNK